MNSIHDDQQTLFPEQITAKARDLWQKAGAPEGRDLEFWLAAEHELRREREDVRSTQRGEINAPPRSTPSGGEKAGETPKRKPRRLPSAAK